MPRRPNKKELVAVVQELNSLLDPDPPIDAEGKVADMFTQVKKAVKLLAKKDQLSQETGAFFQQQGIDHTATVAEAAPPATEEEGEDKPKKKRGPGVIAKIFDLVKDSGPITEDAIVAALKKAFPDRDADAMRRTVKVQLPGRMSRDKGVKIERTDAGFAITG